MERVLRVLGIFFFLAGVVMIAMSISTVTGFVVVERVSGTAGSLAGVILVLAGLLLVFAGIE